MSLTLRLSTDNKSTIVLPNGDRLDISVFNPTKEERIESEENAARIVKCVNANDELLEALKSTKQLNLHLYEEGTVGNRVYNIINQAIEKATK